MGNNIVTPFNDNSQDNQENSLVFAKNGIFFTTSEAIAQGTENEHRAVLQMIEKYQDKFDRFGGVAFEMRPFETAGGIQSKRIALLNNSQATFLMTLLRNNDLVVEFKVRLVEEFEKLAEKAKQAPTPALPFIFYLLTIASESPIIHLFNRFGLETRFDLSVRQDVTAQGYLGRFFIVM